MKKLLFFFLVMFVSCEKERDIVNNEGFCWDCEFFYNTKPIRLEYRIVCNKTEEQIRDYEDQIEMMVPQNKTVTCRRRYK